MKKQIYLCDNPQEFTRLYNVVLHTKYGNDSYVFSEKRMITRRCFKYWQKNRYITIEEANFDIKQTLDFKGKDLSNII